MAGTDPLARYNARRDFARTAEPRGKRAKTGGNRFVVQKHAATRLHWDFRLEVDGVLKSWAVTRGPSADPADKRLAVRTEDHPLDYARFEGTIPEGEYGGGAVMLWDEGTWEPVPGKSAADLEQGHLHFVLHGERMKGEWLLIRLRPRGRERGENWLLRKISDDQAQAGDVLVEQGLTSVLTGRTMAEIAADKAGSHSLAGKRGKAFRAEMKAAATRNAEAAASAEATPKAKAARDAKASSDAEATPKAGAKRRSRKARPKLPGFRPVQLATLVDAVPAGNQWFHEIKFDGYRALVAAAGEEVRIHTRSGLDWTDKFAPLAQAFAALDLPGALIDGEIVATDADGNPDFSALQAVLKRGHGAQDESTPLTFHGFDLLELDGEDLADEPAIARKQRLEALLEHAPPPIHVADHVIGAGERLLAAMCGAGQEGIIAKRIDGRYRGERSRDWLKIKCLNRQEFVIVGWKASTARGRPFASLALAQHEDGALVYKGRVGTGFAGDDLAMLAERMAMLASEDALAEVPRAERRGMHWLRPELVAEIAFAEFTADGSVRHASFLGLRSDKPAREVVPERPVAAPEAPVIAISHRERVIFPEGGQTKGDLADYYAAVAPLMLPFLAKRPFSLVRCPQGRTRQCFFQKHDSGSFGEHVHHVPIADKDGAMEDYMWLDSAAGLLACVQMGGIEFHGWGSRADAVEAPDRMVFDLDPDPAVGFAEVTAAARHLHDRLAELGLVSFAMLSGGKGVHVIVPLAPGHDWAAHKDFAQRFAQALAIAEPERFTASMAKAKRTGRIFIDYLRNQRGSTAVMPWSARARAGAPVAVPVSWGELADCDSAAVHSISDVDSVLARAAAKNLAGWGICEQTLPKM